MRRVLRLACALTAIASSYARLAVAEPPAAPAAPVPPPAEAAAAPAPAPVPDTPAPSATTSTLQASRLALVGETRENRIYIDKPTLRKLTSDKFEVWAQVHTQGGVLVRQFLMQLNCADRSYLVKSEALYGPEGEVIENKTNRMPTLQYVVPDSASEFIYKWVCHGS